MLQNDIRHKLASLKGHIKCFLILLQVTGNLWDTPVSQSQACRESTTTTTVKEE